jgi:hypothetical protein
MLPIVLVVALFVAGGVAWANSGDPEMLHIERDLRLLASFGDAPSARVRLVQDLRLEPS